jgi:hypothetical protein
MKYNPYWHNRHSIRLPVYDYATAGAYFVTVCLNQRISNKMQTQSRIARGQQFIAQGQQF